MIIQCPGCKARYRSKDLDPATSEVKVKCPKCEHLFLVQKNVQGSDEAHKVTSCKSVLVIDDAHFFREMLVDILQPLDLNLSLAATAEDALHQLKRQAFDLVIIDLNLPDKSGLELMREIRQDHADMKVRFLAISGVYRKEDDATEAIRAGAEDFLSKSFTPEELCQRVKKLLKT